MTQAGEWTGREMMAVAASQLVADDDVALVGLGVPQIAALLAKHTHAPGATLLFEIGVFEAEPRVPAMGVADPRIWEGSTAFGSMLDVLGYMLHGGRVSLGLLGALQVDSGGNVNSTQVLDEDGGPRRFLGSGGANDIASVAGRNVIVMAHQPRKFREAVDFVTSPGRRVGARTRGELGLRGAGTVAVVTDRAVLDVTEDGVVLHSVHPGEDPDAVVADTPMTVAVGSAGVAETVSPTAAELRLIRDELDPHRWYTG